MANPEHVDLVKRGARAIDEWREREPSAVLDLRSADLTGLKLDPLDEFIEAAENRSRRPTAGFRSQGVQADDFLEEKVTPLSPADLRGAVLTNCELDYVDLSNCDFSHAQIDRATLHEVNFNHARMKICSLYDCHIDGTSFVQATLDRSFLVGSRLLNVNFDAADLTGVSFEDAVFDNVVLNRADLSRARFSRTSIYHVNLSNAVNLEQICHLGPSSVSFDAILASKLRLPEDFLRGVGFPDALITYLPSLLGNVKPVEYYSCFISYSHKDEEFCRRLYSRMRDEKMRVWYAAEDMPGGKKLHESIDQAIRLHDKLLLVLSDHSMNSEWVKTEIYHARMREAREGKRILFPIRLVPFETIRDWKAFNSDDGKDMAREVREYFIPDFTNWKDHDAFEEAFARLLRDLKNEDLAAK